MKFLILLTLALLVLLSVSAGAELAAPHIEIEIVNQNPYPAEPGKNVNIDVEIKNTGLGEATNLVVELVTKEPFTLLPGEERIKQFSNIGAGKSVKATYEIAVGDSAIANNYNIDFRVYTSSDRSTYTTYSVKVKLQGKTRLLLDEVTLSPEELEPGSSALLGLKIKNIGTGTARQLQIEFNSTETLIPILNRGQDYLGDLDPNSTKDAVFEISIDSSAEKKTYPAIITATYIDDSGDYISKQFTIGIPVIGSVSLDIVNVEVDDKGKLKVEVANKGTTSADSVEAKLVVDNNTVETDYVNQIKPTKKATFSFQAASGQAQLQLTYKITGLGEKQVIKDIVFPTAGGATGLATGGSGFSATASIIVLVVLVVYVFVRRKKIIRKLTRDEEED